MPLAAPDRLPRRSIPCSINTVECGSLASPDGGRSLPSENRYSQRLCYQNLCTHEHLPAPNGITYRGLYHSASRMIQPLTVTFPPESTLPPGWEQHIHPEGLPYFVLSLPAGGQMKKVITEEWMYDRDIAALVRKFIKEIQDAISEHKISILPDSDLFLELHRREGKLTEDDGGAHCGYYFVHHPNRCVYWLEKVRLWPTVSKSLNGVWGDLSEYQAQLCLEAEYWVHWNNFPALHTITPDSDIYEYVVDTILGVMTDVISAPMNTSTIFTYESLHRMLKLVRVAKELKSSSTWHIGRFMMELTQDRLRNYYGSWGTRMEKGQSVIRDREDPHSLTVDIISPLLFFIPHAMLERAEALMADRRFILREWEIFFDGIKEEWNQTALLATIILTANCAFLAIPLFQAPELATHSSAEQIASYLSLMASLFGLMVALVMYRHHKSRRGSSPTDILAHIHGKYTQKINNVHWEHLFLVWSLPHALVIWSAAAFGLAFLLMCLLGTATSAKIIVGVCTLLLGSFTFYYVIKFGSGKKLLRIWVGRILRHVKGIRGFVCWKKQKDQLGNLS